MSYRNLISRVIPFTLTLVNAVFVWSNRRSQSGSSISLCVYCPWYDTWSFTNEPSVLFMAAVLILVGKRWSYFVAASMSGWVLAYGAFFMVRAIINFGVGGYLTGLQKYESNFFSCLGNTGYISSHCFWFRSILLGKDFTCKRC